MVRGRYTESNKLRRIISTNSANELGAFATYLVGGLEHFFSIIYGIIFPIDELIFFKMVIALHHQPDWIWARLRIPKHSDIVDLRNFDVSFDNSSIIGVKCSVNLGLTKKNQDQVSYTLIGGLEHEFYNILWLPFSWEWKIIPTDLIRPWFFRGVGVPTTNQIYNIIITLITIY